MKLALGTAQFGLDYGVSNLKGQVSLPEIDAILTYAKNSNILTLDTASAYGNSEANLGRVNVGLEQFEIVTKTLPGVAADRLESAFLTSLQHLRVNRVYALLIHHASDLLSHEGNKLWLALKALQAKSCIKKIGVSVYNAEEIEAILEKYDIEIIQIPINPFDQRLIEKKLLEKLKNKNIEIHARSLFLQGVLLMELERLPAYFTPYQELFKRFHAILNQYELSPLEGLLSFAYSIYQIDRAVVGVTSLKELEEIKLAYEKVKEFKCIDFKTLSMKDEKLINPSLWKL